MTTGVLSRTPENQSMPEEVRHWGNSPVYPPRTFSFIEIETVSGHMQGDRILITSLDLL